MNKKGITPIIAVVLLLMMTVAAAGAAFYWLTRMQQQAQAGVTGQQQQLIEQASAAVSLVSQSYAIDTSGDDVHNLSIDMQNTGGRSISLANDSIIMVLEDGDGNAVCPSEDLNSLQFRCDTGCSAAGIIAPNQVSRLIIRIDELAANCGTLLDTNTYYYQLKLQKGATISGSFRHE